MYKKIISLGFVFFSVFFSFAQSETGIPYQGILRDNTGSELSNASVTVQAIIRKLSTNGQIIFSESHNVVTDEFGYFQIVIGTGNVNSSFPSFNEINWASDLKFLQIQVNTGTGFVELGTTQLLSVPYALFADDCDCNMSISPLGDTLFTGGGGYLIVPGISNANPEFGGLGLLVLPGNNLCSAQQISVTTCGGDSTITYNGYTYDLVEINNQCWFQENLRTETFNDGTPIPIVTDNVEWNNSTTPAYCKFLNNNTNGSIYGFLYNFYTIENQNLCPVGWHVPTDCEFMFLESSIGMSTTNQQAVSWRGTTEGKDLKSTNLWLSNPGVDSYLFTALPGGFRVHSATTPSQYGIFSSFNRYSFFWTSTTAPNNSGYTRAMFFTRDDISRQAYNKATGAYVRCIRD
jgi:uncharacterized protein (TIGR02145 family)